MVLLITPAARVQESVDILRDASGETVVVTGSLQQAALQVRAQEYSAVVVDQALADAEPEECDIVLQHIGTAIPVFVNFGICGIDRVARELRIALCRRQREVTIARRSAEQALRNELKSTVTAMLLSCEMALKVDNLPSSAEAKIRMVHELARDVKTKLGSV